MNTEHYLLNISFDTQYLVFIVPRTLFHDKHAVYSTGDINKECRIEEISCCVIKGFYSNQTDLD